MMVKEGYKETIIGAIPQEWGFKPLKEVCKFKNGKSTDYYSDLEVGKYNIYGSNGPIGSLNESNFEKGYIVGRVGAVGEIHYIDTPVWVSDNAIQVSIKKNKKVNEDYLFYWLKRRNLGQFSTKSAQPLLNQSTIKTIPIPFPPLPEQKKIASILSSVDKSIKKTDELIEATKELKKGLMQQLLIKGIGYSEFKDTILGKIPAEWEISLVVECCDILDRDRVPLNQKERDEIPGNIPYYGANGIVDYVGEYIFDEKLILLAEDGGHFEEYMDRPIAYIIEGRSWVNNHAHVLKPKDKYHLEWIYYTLVHKNILPYVYGSTRMKLNQKSLKTIPIQLPPLSEQKKIASILSSVDAKIKMEEEYKAKLKRLKKGLMQKLLTGEIRVNTEMEV